VAAVVHVQSARLIDIAWLTRVHAWLLFCVADQPVVPKMIQLARPAFTSWSAERCTMLGGHPLHYYKYNYYLGFHLWSRLLTHQNAAPGLVVAKHDRDVCKHNEIAAQYCHHVTSALAIQLVLNWPLQQNVKSLLCTTDNIEYLCHVILEIKMMMTIRDADSLFFMGLRLRLGG